MNSRQFFGGVVIGAVVSTIIVLLTLPLIIEMNSNSETIEEKQNASYTNFSETENIKYNVPDGLNFIDAANTVKNGVVYIKSTSTGRNRGSLFNQFFTDPDESSRSRRRRDMPFSSSGSGVILTPDGYIVTNHHVINMAERIEVTLNDNQTYQAELIGTDPTTDLALIKIKENNLPFVKYGNSDIVNIGEWVLAVGNPFDLNSTVTAGIVSAKARSIDILRENSLAVESFIQTDAVVNPGNSGGALVNLGGELIGINTAIATRTGSFSGYSFAVPVSLVKKVIEDLKEFGKVQRAILGVIIIDLNSQLAREKNLPISQGVLVDQVNINSSAYDAGIVKDDIIIGIDGKKINSISELQETVARHRPGKELTVKIYRNGEEIELQATLKSAEGNSAAIPRVIPSDAQIEGITVERIPSELLEELEIAGGVRIAEVKEGKWLDAGLQEDFIITFIGDKRINTTEDFQAAVKEFEIGQEVVLIGLYPDGKKSFYSFTW